MRTSQATGRVAPIRSTSRSCNTRNSFTCIAGDISVISSRNSVPPALASISPFFTAVAPVNAPFSWPNNSLSSSGSANAPQLTAVNGASRRPLQ